MRAIVLLFIFTVIIGCTNTPEPKSRYSIKQDKAPVRLPTAAETQDIIPRYEPYSRGGNMSNYTVRGISYQVLKQAANFEQTGNASWYGEKFHGHLTSNGETYNMYGLSAAHTQLPLPSFVKVTNLVNNKTVVVRVNDRGPFHPNRIIDLSYGAAHRLDMLNSGTTRVKIEVLTFAPDTPAVIAPPVLAPKAITTKALTPKALLPKALASKALKQKVLKPQVLPVITTEPIATTAVQPVINISSCVVQLAATSNKHAAELALAKMTKQYQVASQIEQAGSFHRMQLGPLDSKQACDLILQKITDNYPKAFIKML